MKKSVETQDLNLNKLVDHLLKKLQAKDRQMEQLNQTIANLTETINEMKRKIFGISSEKSSNVPGFDGQFSLFDQLGVDGPVQVPETTAVASHEKKKSRATHDELAKIFRSEPLILHWKTKTAIALTATYQWMISDQRSFAKKSGSLLRRSNVFSMSSTAMHVHSVARMVNLPSGKHLFRHR